jgi:hypothetical protein
MRFLNKQLSLTLALILVSNTSVFGEGEQRWSRQLSPDTPVTANDWVPLRNGKTISFGEDLTPAAQQQYQFFSEPLNNRFNLQQQHPAHPGHQSEAPSEINSFSSQNAPSNYQFFNSQPQKQRTVQNFGGPIINNKPLAEPLVQSPPPFQYMQEIQRGPHVHHYQSQPIPKTLQNFPQSQPQYQQQQSRAPHFQKLPPPPPFQPVPTPPQFQPLQGEQQPQSEEQPQLLYVPFDSLYQNQQREQSSGRYNILNQPVSAALINDFYSQNEVQEFPTKPATTRKPVTTKRPTIAPVTSNFPTTPFENVSKPKPHQPPLSMFVAVDKFKGEVSEADVLNTLRNSNSIDVMDQVSKNSPKVFIGPSGMSAPPGYSKFDLPYLSNIEGTRHERRIEQLPFFVAPLSYRTPPGFSKIPLPAPHVGSVVVNQPANSIDSNESSGFTQDNYFTKQPFGSTVQTQLNSESSPKTQKVVLTSGFNYSPGGNVQLIRNEFTFPTLSPASSPATNSRTVYTTPRSTFAQTAFAQTASPTTAEAPLTKVAYKQIEEKRNYGQSTYNPSTTTRTPATRTKSADYFPTSARSTARPQTTKSSYVELDEHKTVNEEYFGVPKEKKQPTFSFKFGTEVEKPSPNFNFRPIPDFNIPEEDYTTTKKPRTKSTTQLQYSFPSSTPLPTPSFEYTPTVSVIENTETFGNVNGGSPGNYFEFRSTPRPVTQDLSFNSNRFNFGNEQTYKSYTPQQYTQEISEDVKEPTETSESTTETSNYSLPSELPAISPQLPGWINSLMDDKWMQKPNITEEVSTTTTTTTTTRRPNNRGSRRPTTSSNRSTATDSTVERRQPTRRSRPTAAYTSRNSIATTESSFPSRSTVTVSRGSKVKFNGTSEERGKFRTRSRTPVKKEESNIAYQRDVLNQNYPSSIRPYAGDDTTTEKTIVEEIHIQSEQHQGETPNAEHIVNDYNAPLESVEVIPLGGNTNYNNENEYISSNRPLYYDNTIETSTLTTTSTTQEPSLPSNHKQNNFGGLQEPMQVPHHKTVAHRLKSNFKHRNIDSFYNTNSQDSTTQKSEHGDDETLITVPTTEATSRFTTVAETSATEVPIPRRTSFPRRRLPLTTTESPSNDVESTESSRVNCNSLYNFKTYIKNLF